MSDLPVTTRFLFARHGQTIESLHGAFCGVTEAPLTPVGHVQAHRLAERLRHEHIDALYCSPQQRTLDTAAPIAATLGLEIQLRSALREMDFGQWEGHRKADLAQEYPQAIALWERGSWMIWPPGGETQQAVLARAIQCVFELLTAHLGQTLLIIAHRTLLRLLIGHLLDMSLPASRALQLEPASLSEVQMIGDQMQLILYNDIRHLINIDINTH